MSKKEFIAEIFKMKAAISREENILFYYPALESVFPFKHPDEQEQERRELHFNKFYRKKLLKFLQKYSEYALIYGSQYSDECYFGEGKVVDAHIIKKDRKQYLDLSADLWSGCSNFWVANDYHSNDRMHSNGDFYFFIDPKTCDWKTLLSYIDLDGCLSYLKSSVKSKAGYRHVTNIIGENDLIVFEFFTQTIRASQENLARLMLLSYAYSDSISIFSMLDLEENPDEIIFSTEENAQKALDFNNKDYHCNLF